MSKGLRNGIIAAGVILVISVGLGALGASSISVMATSCGIGAVVWYILQNLSGNRAVSSVTSAERARLLAEPPPPGQALIYVYREGFVGRAVGYDVVLDFVRVAQLKSPRCTRVVVSPGDHTLAANPPGFAGTQSKAGSIAFTIQPGETIVFALKLRVGMVQGAVELLRELDARTAVARLATITMVTPEITPAVSTPAGAAPPPPPL